MFEILGNSKLNHRPSVVGGIEATECGELLKAFFRKRRASWMTQLEGNSMKLSLELAELLLKKEYKIGLAESCTGGGIAKVLTDLPGSSNWLKLGVVTYSNEAKEKILGVSKSLLESYGAVSEPVAKAMVEGDSKVIRG